MIKHMTKRNTVEWEKPCKCCGEKMMNLKKFIHLERTVLKEEGNAGRYDICMMPDCKMFTEVIYTAKNLKLPLAAIRKDLRLKWKEWSE